MDTRIMGIHSRKLPVPRRFYNPSDIFSELGLSRGRKGNISMYLFCTSTEFLSASPGAFCISTRNMVPGTSTLESSWSYLRHINYKIMPKSRKPPRWRLLLHGQFDVIVTLSDLLLLTPLTPFLITASHERKFKIQRRIEVVVKVVLLALILVWCWLLFHLFLAFCSLQTLTQVV